MEDVKNIRGVASQSFTEFYELYLLTRMDLDAEPISKATLWRGLYTHFPGSSLDVPWSKRLKFQKRSQHSKCNDCEQFKHWLRSTENYEDLKQHTINYTTHLEDVHADRCADDRVSKALSGPGSRKRAVSGLAACCERCLL